MLDAFENRTDSGHPQCHSTTAAPSDTSRERVGRATDHSSVAVVIPNDFIRALDQFADYLAVQGRDADERLARLRRNCNHMSPTSRESAAQLLDFVLSVLSPLGDIMPPIKPRKRAMIR